MTQFAKGGIITGSRSTPLFAPVPQGYVLSVRVVRELGGAASFNWLAKLNAANRFDGHQE